MGLNISSAAAQVPPRLDEVYPRTGGRGTEVQLLLRGTGFNSLGELTGVQIGGREIPAPGYAPLSNELIRASILVPDSILTGETEISFLFENIGLDAFFVVTPGGAQDATPFIHQVEPLDGPAGSEMGLSIRGERLFDLGGLAGVLIGGLEVPVLGENQLSDQSMEIAIYLPPELPLGETEIDLFFENYSGVAPFFVREPGPGAPMEPPGPPVLLGLSPPEVQADSEVALALQGEGFSQLGPLLRVVLAGAEIPLLDQAILSGQDAQARIFVPAETPEGDAEIVFSFENGDLEATLTVIQPGPEGFPWIWILVVCVVGVAGFVLGRVTHPKPPTPSRPEIHFIQERGPGSSSIEPADRSLKLEADIRLETSVESDVSTQPEHEPIIKESRPL